MVPKGFLPPQTVIDILWRKFEDDKDIKIVICVDEPSGSIWNLTGAGEDAGRLSHVALYS